MSLHDHIENSTRALTMWPVCAPDGVGRWLGRVTGLSHCSRFILRMRDSGLPSKPLATVTSLWSWGRIRKQRLFKEIQWSWQTIQLPLYFQEATALVFIFLLFPLYINHKWNVSSPRGHIHSLVAECQPSLLQVISISDITCEHWSLKLD